MTLLYTEVEEELRAAVRDVLTDRCSPSSVLARVESASPYDLDLWKTLARDIGLAGLLIPEELGGAGASAREVAVVLEELGRAVAPVPFLTSAVLATRALLTAESPPSGTAVAPAGAGAGTSAGHHLTRARDLLERLASGEIIAALAVPFAASPYRWLEPTITLAADRTAGGQVTGVVGAEVADVLIVPVRLAPGRWGEDVDERVEGGVALCAVDASAPGVDITPVASLDLTRPIATVSLSAVSAEPISLRVAPDGCEVPVPGVRDALSFGAGLLASEQLGVAEWCLSSTVAYVRERKQFARPVGSFQAIKHRLADLWLEIVGARAAARNVAHLLSPVGDADEELTAVAVAQAYCGEVAVHAAEECVQLHGGIGMTWEHPAHLYLKRAKADEIALGTPGDHRDALAALADLPPPA